MERTMGNTLRKTYCGPHTIVSSLGFDSKECFDSIMNGTASFKQSPFGCPVAIIDRSKLDDSHLVGHSYAEKLAILSLAKVISLSGESLDKPRNLLVVSTTKGNIDCLNSDIERSYLWSMANNIGKHFGCVNKPLIVSNACISGVASVVIASRLIARGEYDNIYVLGVDIVSDFVVSGFNSFKSLSATVCRPYDAKRDGLTLGEACGVLMLTSSLANSDNGIFVSGGALSDDANHISGPSRTGDGLLNAILGAMSQAAVNASDIGYINAHGTGTIFNDEMESKAFCLASLSHIPCNSLKPYLGHTLGASGVVEIILSIMQMQSGVVFGVEGYGKNGVPHELNICSRHRKIDFYHTLKTASGFGGTNAAIVLSKSETSDTEYNLAISRDLKCSEVASVSVVKEADTGFGPKIRNLYKSLGEQNLKFFKMDNLSKLGYVASCLLLKDMVLGIDPTRVGLVISSCSASLDTDLNHQSILNQNLPEGTSPAVFVYTLANVVAAEIAIKHRIKGELSVFVSETKNMDFMEYYSRKLIEDNICDAVIYGWCELLHEDYEADFKLIKL
jgi:3-oxoacyl-(acyl-carrier-protein) synthase